MNTLSGGAADWILESKITENELYPYQYPSRKEFNDTMIFK